MGHLVDIVFSMPLTLFVYLGKLLGHLYFSVPQNATMRKLVVEALKRPMLFYPLCLIFKNYFFRF